ncbi:MAG: hypothetical protein ABIM99_06285 [Candidatus Dojkabacteria bacterium]
MGHFLSRLLLTLVVIILVISTTALGVLFVVRSNDYNNSQNELSKVKEDLKAAQGKILDLQAAAKDPNTKLTFSDTGLGIKVEFPASWTPISNTKVELESTTTATTLKSLEVKFTKTGATVTFSRLFGPVGDLAVGYPTSTYDVKEVSSKIIRVADKGTNKWSYKAKVDCADAIEVPAGTTVCGSGSFFPGFGTGGGAASFASVETSDATLLLEADTIVVSALN